MKVTLRILFKILISHKQKKLTNFIKTIWKNMNHLIQIYY